MTESADLGMQCLECGHDLGNPHDNGPSGACPICGSTNRRISVRITEQIAVRDILRAEVKDPSRSRRRRLRKQVIKGDEVQRSSGRWMKKCREIDRDGDRYREKIVDAETGEVVHEVDEPLSRHQGHGSARKGKTTPGKGAGKEC